MFLHLLFAQEREKRARLGDAYEEPAPSGIPGWHLGVPSWAEGMPGKPGKAAFKAARRKTALCRDWLAARGLAAPAVPGSDRNGNGGVISASAAMIAGGASASASAAASAAAAGGSGHRGGGGSGRSGRGPPAGAPRWWGCPRGPRCEFAHGDEELRSEARLEAAAACRDAAMEAARASLEKYTAGLYLYRTADDDDGRPHDDHHHHHDGAGGRGGSGAAGGEGGFMGAGRSMLATVMQGLSAQAAAAGGAGAAAGGVKRKPAASVSSSGSGTSASVGDKRSRTTAGLSLSGDAPRGLAESSASAAASASVDRADEEDAAASVHVPAVLDGLSVCLAGFSGHGWLVSTTEPSAAGASATAAGVDVAYLEHGVTPLCAAPASAADGAAPHSGDDSPAAAPVPAPPAGVAPIAEATGRGDFGTAFAAGVACVPPPPLPFPPTEAGVAASTSITASGASVRQYYYEVELLSSGVMQVGWVDGFFLARAAVPAAGLPASVARAAAVRAAAAGAASAAGRRAAARSSSGAASAGAGADADGGASGGSGVGDDGHSWAFDGCRGLKWHAGGGIGPQPYPLATPAQIARAQAQAQVEAEADAGAEGGSGGAADATSAAPAGAGAAVSMPRTALSGSWQEGDVIGCLLSLSTSWHGGDPGAGAVTVTARFSFTLNGADLGTAFESTMAGVHAAALTPSSMAGSDSSASAVAVATGLPPSCLFVPALSMEAGEVARINLGAAGFAYAHTTRTAHNTESVGEQQRASAVSVALMPIESLIQAQEEAGGAAAGDAASKGVTHAASFIGAVPVYASSLPLDAAEAAAVALLSKRPRLAAAGPVDSAGTVAELAAAGVSLDALRDALAARGLKTGGSWAERAERLVSVRGLRAAEVPPKLRGAGFPGPAMLI